MELEDPISSIGHSCWIRRAFAWILWYSIGPLQPDNEDSFDIYWISLSHNHPVLQSSVSSRSSEQETFSQYKKKRDHRMLTFFFYLDSQSRMDWRNLVVIMKRKVLKLLTRQLKRLGFRLMYHSQHLIQSTSVKFIFFSSFFVHIYIPAFLYWWKYSWKYGWNVLTNNAMHIMDTLGSSDGNLDYAN